MDYSAVSQIAKRFEQESKVSHKIGEVKQKIIAVLRENWMSNVEGSKYFKNIFPKKKDFWDLCGIVYTQQKNKENFKKFFGNYVNYLTK